MKKKIAILLLASLACTAVFGSTASFAGEAPKEITVGWPYEPESLDPARSVNDASYRILRMSGEALLRNVDDQAQPGVAESYEVSDDNMEYTFHLRKDAVYSDGTPITSADFVYTIKRLLDQEGAYEAAETAYVVKNAEKYYNGECDESELGIEAVDDYTLKLTLEYPTYPLSFTNWAFEPVNQAKAEELGLSYGAEAANVLTNGPYNITGWTHDSEVVLEKNPSYWDADSIKLDKIVCKLNATGDTAVDMMQAGELDVASVESQMQADVLTDSGFLSDLVTTGWENVHINHAGSTEETGLFLSNTNFRKALNYALDRTALVAAVYTTDQAADRMIGPSEEGVNASFQEEYSYEGWPVAGDPEKAKECLNAALEELGKTAEEIPTFSILCYDSNNNMITMNAVMDMWQKTLGITCQIDAQPIQNMVQKAYNGEFDFWKGGTSSTSIDSLEYFAGFTSGEPIYNNNDEAYDELYNKALYAGTWQERKDDLFELEKYFCSNVVDLVMTWPGVYYVYTDKLTGVTADVISLDITYADLTE